MKFNRVISVFRHLYHNIFYNVFDEQIHYTLGYGLIVLFFILTYIGFFTTLLIGDSLTAFFAVAGIIGIGQVSILNFNFNFNLCREII